MTPAITGNGPECWGWDAELQQSIPLPENCPNEFPWLTTTTTVPDTVVTTTTVPATTTTVAPSTTSTTVAPTTVVDTTATTVLPGIEVVTTTTGEVGPVPELGSAVVLERTVETTTTTAEVTTPTVPTLPVTGVDLSLPWIGGALLILGVALRCARYLPGRTR